MVVEKSKRLNSQTFHAMSQQYWTPYGGYAPQLAAQQAPYGYAAYGNGQYGTGQYAAYGAQPYPAGPAGPTPPSTPATPENLQLLATTPPSA